MRLSILILTIAIINLGLINAQSPRNDQSFAWTGEYNFQVQAVTPYENTQRSIEDRVKIDAVISEPKIQNVQMRPVTAP
ncbi:GSCOCT00014093001.2-RA-CDS [Cotesia congregata]|uniref:Venom protein 14 n=1 Tax=Cotesia congregata TaxID=51543 RepID=A0A8J2MG29_COTCN|nr:GSCOCT00014093001.2-RA-CDS [Cotesia congregata]CAG5078928.1 Putative venom protein 14 [Cotesia congregata]